MTWLLFAWIGALAGVLVAFTAVDLPDAILRESVAAEAGIATAPSWSRSARIGIRLPRFMAATVAATLVARAVAGPGLAGLAIALLSTALIAAGAIDLEHRLLPDALTLPLLWAGLLVNLVGTFATLHDAVLGAAIGYLVPWAMYWIFRIARGVEAIGHGDIKLYAALGAWFGWQAVPWLIVVSSVAGALAAIALMKAGRLRRHQAIAFGPCIAFAGWVVWYWPHAAC